VEQEIPEVRKRMERLSAKIPLLEDTLQKQEKRIEAAIQETKKYEEPIEELRISDFQREQKMKRYLDQGEQVAQELEKVREQTQVFLEQRQEVKRALSALEKFKDRIERRQDEMSERQRIAEERITRQWEEWQDNRAKELKKQEIVTEERWQAQEKTNMELDKRLEKIPPVLKKYHAQLEALWEVQRDDAQALLNAAQDVYEALIAPIDEQLETLQEDQQE
jgi:chromosome segregation ATPase